LSGFYRIILKGLRKLQDFSPAKAINHDFKLALLPAKKARDRSANRLNAAFAGEISCGRATHSIAAAENTLLQG
jgi:hypothetical protein